MITSRVTVGPPDGRSATKDGSETRSCNANLKPANMSVQAGLMRLEEYLGSITGWPMWMRELLSKTHLEYNDRLTIAGVLLGNLVPPIVAAEHVHAKLADGCARLSMRDIFVKIGTGEVKYTYWDVDDKKVQPLVYLGAASSLQPSRACSPTLTGARRCACCRAFLRSSMSTYRGTSRRHCRHRHRRHHRHHRQH